MRDDARVDARARALLDATHEVLARRAGGSG